MGGDHQRRGAETILNVMLDIKESLLVDKVHLVDRDERRHVDPVSLHRIDEIFLRRVATDQNLRVHHLALGEDGPHVLNIEVEGPDRREPDTADRGLLDGDVGFRDVDTDARIVELLDEHVHVLAVEDVHEDNDDVGAPHDADDFLAPALAHGGTCDKSRDIEQLDLRALVFERAGHHGEGGKRIRGDRALGTGELVEERAFTGRREPDEDCGRVARLLDRVAFPAPPDFIARKTASSRSFAIFAFIRPICLEVALL